MDIETPGAYGTDAILCPYEGRRSITGLWMKLFIIHFATIALFCHVLSSRGERVVSWKLFFYFWIPYNVFAFHGFALAGITFKIITILLRRQPLNSDEELRRGLKWFLGTIPATQDIAARQALEDAAETEAVEESEIFCKKLWRFIEGLVVFAQCTMSIVLYVRRRNRGAATIADEKIFQLASTGLVTTMYAMGMALQIPPFGQPTPTASPEERTSMESFLISCRDTVQAPLAVKGAGPKASGLHFESFMRNFWMAAFLLSCFGPLPIFSIAIIPAKVWPLTFGVFLIMCLISIGICLGSRSSHDVAKACLLPLGSPLYVSVLYFIMMAVFLPVVCPPVFWYELITQIESLENWPTDSACPLLWNDPASSYLWTLA